MNSKVEVISLDTNKLPKISSTKMTEMIKEYKLGNKSLKDEIVNSNLRLVLSLVRKFNNRGENVDDIFQIGVIGLIKAIDNFDVSQQVLFSTYAVPMIIGEIKRYLRDNNSFKVARSIRDLSFAIAKEREAYIEMYNEEPTIEKICNLVGRDREDVVVAMESITKPMSLNDVIYNDGGDCIFVQDKIKDDKDEQEEITDKIAIEQILSNLTEKEKYIIERRYFKDKTQVELSKELGVSQAQVSRIEKNALMRIREKIRI